MKSVDSDRRELGPDAPASASEADWTPLAAGLTNGTVLLVPLPEGVAFVSRAAYLAGETPGAAVPRDVLEALLAPGPAHPAEKLAARRRAVAPAPRTRRVPETAGEASLESLATVRGWPQCDYWSLDLDVETLSAESIPEALDLGTLRDPEHAMAWLLRWKERGRLTLHGWTRKVVTDDAIESMVECLTDAFHEHWCEGLELGDPEDADGRVIEPPWLRAAVTADMHARRVWSCEPTRTVELTPDDVIAIARIVAPELELARAWGAP